MGALGNCLYHFIYPGMPLHNEMMIFEKKPYNLSQAEVLKLSQKVGSGVTDLIKLGNSRLVNGRLNHGDTVTQVVPAELLVDERDAKGVKP